MCLQMKNNNLIGRIIQHRFKTNVGLPLQWFQWVSVNKKKKHIDLIKIAQMNVHLINDRQTNSQCKNIYESM